MSLSSFNCQFRKLTGENPRKMRDYSVAAEPPVPLK